DGEGDVDQAAVLPSANGVEVLHGLALGDLREDVSLLAQTLPGDEEGDRLSDHLFGPIPEEPFGPAVPGGDDPLEVLRNDRVVRGLDDGSQARRSGLRALPFGNV